VRSSPPLAEVRPQDVVGHGEEVGAEAGLLLEPVPRLDAAEEGLLDQIVDAVRDLVGEETTDRVEVALEEGITGLAVTCPPGVEELEVCRHVDYANILTLAASGFEAVIR
jgi:hypothetical protein